MGDDYSGSDADIRDLSEVLESAMTGGVTAGGGFYEWMGKTNKVV